MQPQYKSWQEMRAWQVELLERSTGDGLDTWRERISANQFADENALRGWLKELGVTGYAQMLLVHETFGYPEFFTKSAEQLIEAQYADRTALRPILDAVLQHVHELAGVTLQARKTYLAVLSPRRTFAVVKASTRTRVDLGLRLPDQQPTDRLLPATSIGASATNLRIPLTAPEDVDDEAIAWLRRAYQASL